jgi:UDP-N-acetylmuramoyl-tripeptide--D-alanyl-D-alanine ligase
MNDSLGTLDWVVRAVGGRRLGPSGTVDVVGVSTDTRSLRPGDLFVALRGPRFDGHAFIAEAAAKGAAAVLVSGSPPDPVVPAVLVPDTLEALQRLAASQRARMQVQVVGVTGTNGKTTTKDLTALVLGTRFSVLKTEGNFNNQIGLPLMLLRLRSIHRVAVLEMGMSGLGEIELLCRLSRPSLGVLTNIAPAHTLQLGSVENIARAKGELADALGSDGTLVANGDDPLVRGIAEGARCKVLTYGIGGGADLVARDISVADQGSATFRVEGVVVRLQLWGRHNVHNALAALLVGHAMGVPLEEGAAALASARPAPGRMVVRTVHGVTVIDDSYNANPASVESAIGSLRMMAVPGKSVLVLGEMRELGDYTEEGHRRVGRACVGVDVLIGLGSLVGPALEEAASHGVRVHSAGGHDEAARLLMEILEPGDAVLFKGSRAVAIERVLELWEDTRRAEEIT